MDETQTPEALNPTVAEDSNVTTPPVEETTTSDESVEQPVEGEQPQPEEQTQQTEEAERKQPRPAERRIRQLANELKQKNEELDRLNQSSQLPPQALDVNPFLEGRDSIDPQELNQYIQQQAAQATQNTAALEVAKLRDEMSRKDAINQFDRDSAEVSKELEALPPELAALTEEKISNAFQARAFKVNPYNKTLSQIDSSVRLADIAKEYIEVAKAAAEYGKSLGSSAISDALDTQAVSSTTTTPKEDVPFEQLDVKTMEAKLRAQGYFKT